MILLCVCDFFSISTDATKSVIVPELDELSRDDQVDVRCTALTSLYNLLPLVDEGMFYLLMPVNIAAHTFLCTSAHVIHLHYHFKLYRGCYLW